MLCIIEDFLRSVCLRSAKFEINLPVTKVCMPFIYTDFNGFLSGFDRMSVDRCKSSKLVLEFDLDLT